MDHFIWLSQNQCITLISSKNFFEFPLSIEYYAAHFPFYPLLIKLAAIPLSIAWPEASLYAPLLITLLASIFAIFYFQKLISHYLDKDTALLATIFFAIFPARWLIVRSVGSPEPLFIGAIIASVYYFKNKSYWLASLFGMMAVATKSPGILLFIAYIASLIVPEIKHLATHSLGKWLKSLPWQAYPLMLMPLSLLAVFSLYAVTFNNFWAYFNSGDNIHLFFPPFQIFNYSAPWVGTFWLEEVIFVYLLGSLALVNLIKMREQTLAWFVDIFFSTILFVSHRDIIRYSLPIVPFLFV